MQQLPITINRSLLGLFTRFIAGGGIAVLVFVFAYYLGKQQGVEPVAPLLTVLIAVVVSFVTVMSILIYSAGKIVLTDEGVQVHTWMTLFATADARCDWEQIEDITVQEAGILALVFGYGTLTIKTASGRSLELSNVPRADYWRDFIDARE